MSIFRQNLISLFKYLNYNVKVAKSTSKISVYILFLLLFFVFAYSCTRQHNNNYPPQLEKAIQLFYLENRNEEVLNCISQLTKIELADSQTALISQLFKAAALCESGKPDSAYRMIKSLNPMNENDECKFWYKSMQGLVLFRMDQLGNAYKILTTTINSTFIDKRALALNERLLARISFDLGDQGKAVEWLVLSTRHFNEAVLPKSIGVNLKLEGRNYMNNHNYAEAKESFSAAEKIFIQQNDKLELFYIYINFVDYYIKTNDLLNARIYANKCLTQCNDVVDNMMRTLVYNNIAEIEMKSGNYDEAIIQFYKTLQIKNNYQNANIRQANAHLKLSEIYLQQKSYNDAIFHALQARSLLPTSSHTELKNNIYKTLAKSVYSAGNKVAAFSYLDSANNFIDSAYLSATSVSKAFYNNKAELMKATYDLDNMKAKERIHRTIYVSIILLALALGVFAFILIFQQQSKNKVLKALVRKYLELLEDERKLRQAPQKIKRQNKSLNTENHLYERLIEWLEKNKQFSRTDLTVDVVAKELSTNRDYLSNAISEKGKRFNDLINKFRVDEAISILNSKCDKRRHYNLTIIASEVGFKSNSVFIEAFRKQTGMNPAQFRASACADEKVETN